MVLWSVQRTVDMVPEKRTLQIKYHRSSLGTQGLKLNVRGMPTLRQGRRKRIGGKDSPFDHHTGVLTV